MKVTKSELNDFGLYENLPQPLKDLSGDDKFVFYYDVNEKEIKLNIYEFKVVKDVNVMLYRDLPAMQQYHKKILRVGFFTTNFESRDGLFYQFLRTYNDADSVKKFYSFLAEQDKIVDLNVSTDSYNEINLSEDFRRAMSYFCKGRLQSIMFVYDMVDSAFKKRLSKSLYGDTIKKVVNLIVFDGGVLPDIGGRLRYMVIGENANLTEQQKAKLLEAKLLIRSMQPFDKVYQYTGWALSDKDGKWRTNIADDESKIIETLLYDYQGRKLYIPANVRQDEMDFVLKNNNRVSDVSYRGRLVDVLHHPTLYNYYPKLALMPIFYHFSDTPMNNLQGRYYYSSDEKGGFIVMNGSSYEGESISILLHEIQHYIQDVEGFATGGNLFLAEFVASVGSESVRKIFSSINKMQRKFLEYLHNETSRLELISVIKKIKPKTNVSASIKNNIMEILEDSNKFNNEYKNLNFYIVIFISEEGDYTTNDLFLYLESKILNQTAVLYELFNNVTEGYKASKNYQDILKDRGYTANDIRIILFAGYENLYGEMESRSVQSSRFVESQFKNYFFITRWENTPFQKLTVIDGKEEIIDLKGIIGAVENKESDYVMHFKRNISSISYLHELGHIVCDALIQLGYGERIKKEFDNDVFSDNIDEYFVDKFLGYLKIKVDDANIISDLSDYRIKDNQEINSILDEFFADYEISKRLKFLQTILSV